MVVGSAVRESRKYQDGSELRGQRIAFAGRLSSLSRAEVRQLVEHHGGTAMRSVTRNTTLLVVGQRQLPLARSGRLSRNLRRAYRLRQQDVPLQIEEEYVFLTRLQGGASQVGSTRLFSVLEIASIVGVSGRRLRTWLEMGLIEPTHQRDGIQWFDYRQLAAVRTLCSLHRNCTSSGRFRRSIKHLAKLLPQQATSLNRLVNVQFNGPLLWRNDGGQLRDFSGQLHFDFADEREHSVPFVPRPEVVDCFEVACQAEADGRLDDAEAAYRRALLSDGDNVDIHFNLGNVLVSLKRYDQAMECYRRTLQLEPKYVEAWNNLGVALGELRRLDEACDAFRSALQLDPAYADALYNLADALDRANRPTEARRYWLAYLKHDRESSWGRFAWLRAAELPPDN